MIRTYIANEVEVRASLDQRGERLKAEFRGGIGRLALKLQKLVKLKKLRGQVLGYRTGRLNNSILQGVIDEGEKIVGRVSTNLFYGVGWELGWPDRKTLESAKSKFSVSGTDFFKNGTPKRRSFLGSALRDLESSGMIREELNAAIARASA